MRGGAKLLAASQFLQCSNRGAQSSAHINNVASTRARAKDGFASRNSAYNNDVGQNAVGRLRGISAGERDRITPRQLQKSADEVIDPLLRKFLGQSEGEECRVGRAAHGRDVTESAGKAAVPDGIGRMRFAAKVNVLQREVCCNQQFVPAWDAEHGAVVADASAGFLAAMGGGRTSNAVDELEFFCRHSCSTTY